MSSSSTNDSFSIFQDGKLKPGVYRIQNVESETYLDFHLRSMELCCRPPKDLERERGFWEIKSLGEGYGIWRVHLGNPHQSCGLIKGTEDAHPVCISTYPSCWRIPCVDDKSEYVRFHFGSSDRMLHLRGGSRKNGAEVVFWSLLPSGPYQNYQKWRLVPVRVRSANVASRSSAETSNFDPPPYEEDDPEQFSASY